MPHIHSRPQSHSSHNSRPPPSYASSASSSEFPRREQQYPSYPLQTPISFEEFLSFCINGEPYVRLLNTFSNEEEQLLRIDHIHHCLETTENLRAMVRQQLDTARWVFYEMNRMGGQEILRREYRRPRRLHSYRRPTPHPTPRRRSPPIIVEHSPSPSPDPNDIPLSDESIYHTLGSQENPIIIDERPPHTEQVTIWGDLRITNTQYMDVQNTQT
jgi:hypothetical protein